MTDDEFDASNFKLDVYSVISSSFLCVVTVFRCFFSGFKVPFDTSPKGKLGKISVFFSVHFHHIEVQIPRKAIAVTWSLELP